MTHRDDYAAPWVEGGIASVYDRNNDPVADVFGAGEGGTRDRARLISKAYLIPELEAAISAAMATLNFYIGPGARRAVGQESIAKYRRIEAVLKELRAP